MSDAAKLHEEELYKVVTAPDSPEKIARNERLRKTGVKIVLVIGGTALGLTALTIPFCLPAVRKVCVPYVPATPVQINNILKCLNTHSFPKAKVIDLGSGDGRVCISCAKEGYKTTGVELNSVLWAFSNLKKYIEGVSNLCTFRKRNLFKEDFSQYDAITIFGAPTMMQALEPKVAKECTNAAKLVVCRYPFLKWAPNYTYGNGIDSVWVYHKPFKMNKSLPAIYHDLVEFADHPLHPSNRPNLEEPEHIRNVTEEVEASDESSLASKSQSEGNQQTEIREDVKVQEKATAR